MPILARLFPRGQTRSEAEREYLNQSVSRYDLECRERDIARGMFAGYYEPMPSSRATAARRTSAGSFSTLTSHGGKGMEMLFSLKMSHSAK